MSTDIRPELSKRNKYWISKHRFYELKHYCLQYKEWQRAYNALSTDVHTITPSIGMINVNRAFNDPTGNTATTRSYYFNKMDEIRRLSKEADPELADYIFLAVTSLQSYTYLKTKLGMPCSKDIFYDRYRKFFWLLDKVHK